MVSESEFFQLAEFLAEVVAEKFCQESANFPQVPNWYFSLSTKQKVKLFSFFRLLLPPPNISTGLADTCSWEISQQVESTEKIFEK
jgi:hypothetical protein